MEENLSSANAPGDSSSIFNICQLTDNSYGNQWRWTLSSANSYLSTTSHSLPQQMELSSHDLNVELESHDNRWSYIWGTLLTPVYEKEMLLKAPEKADKWIYNWL